MKKNKLLLGLGLLMSFGLFLNGCGDPSTSGPTTSNSSLQSSSKEEPSSSSEHEHHFEVVDEIINDCESDIIEILVCHECKEEKKQQSQNYRKHEFGPWEIIEEPTEEKPGLERHVCGVCGKIEEEEIDILDHVHNYEVVSTTRPTCEEDGYKVYKCSCGDEYSQVYKEATGHDYQEWIIEIYPSFEESGYAKRYCSVDSNHIQEVHLPILNEEDYSYNILEEPTCQNYGSAQVFYKKDGIEIETYITLEPIPHNYGVWELITKPTHKEGGLLERECKLCQNEKEEHKIPSLEATAFYSFDVSKPATCTEEGLATCSFKYQEQEFSFETNLPVLEHSYTALPPSYIDATCETPRYIKYSCVCGDYILEADGLALGHDFYNSLEIIEMPTEESKGLVRNYCERNKEHYVDYDLPTLSDGSYHIQTINYPSCVTEGLVEYTYYLQGNEELRVIFEVKTPKTQHNYEYDVRTYYATCTTDGKTVFKCLCGESYEEVFESAYGHEIYYVNEKEPTCDRKGNIAYYLCKRCDGHFLDENCTQEIEYEDTLIAPLGHSYSQWSVYNYPTMEYYGKLIRTCERGCEEFKSLVPFKEADAYDYELVTPNTCEEDGLEIYSYKIDNQTFEFENILKPLGHSYGEWQKEIDPTLEKEGELIRICSIDENHIDHKSLPKLNEVDYAYTQEVAPTCEENGLGRYVYSFALAYYEYEVELSMLGHNYSKFEIIETPSKENVGLIEKVCLNDDNHIVQIELPILNEEDYVYKLITKPLCEEEGLESYTYIYEEQEFVIEVVLAKTGHEVDKAYLYDESVHYDVCACGKEFNHKEHVFENEYCVECGVHESIKYLSFGTKNGEQIYYISGSSSELTYLVVPKEYKGLPVKGVMSENSLKSSTQLETVVIHKDFDMKSSRVFQGVPSLRNLYFEGTLLDWINTPISSSAFNSEELHLFILDDKNQYQEVIDLVVPQEATVINEYQFARFTEIKTVVIPSNVKTISKNAFEYCKGLINVFIEDGVETIKEYAFRECVSLEEVKLSNTITVLEGAAFQKCSALKSIEIPDSLLRIEYMVFQDCISLESIEFNDKLEHIGSSAFYNCDSLTSVEIPSSVTVIETGAFIQCDELLTASILNPDCYLYESIFLQCYKLQEITFPIATNIDYFFDIVSSDIQTLRKVVVNGGEKVPFYFFKDYKTITSITLAPTIKTIESSSFQDCDALEGIIIPESVELIDYAAFYDCDSLEYVNISNTVKVIEEYAFYSCERLVDLSLNEGLEIINNQAFNGCFGLKEVVIPNTLQTIGELAFSSCSNLENVVISNQSTLKVIENRAFNSCYSLLSIYLPKTLETLGERAFNNCYALEEVNFAYGIKIAKIGKETFFACQSLLSANLENCTNLVLIDEGAFQQTYSLKSVTIPASVETIGVNAFAFGFDGKLSFEEGSKLKIIESYAFRSYTQPSLVLPEGLEIIGSEAFSMLEIEELTIPSTVKEIKYRAFGLVKNVYLPNSINKLGFAPFNGHRTDEKYNIHYNGTLEQVLSIELYENGSLDNRATWYFNGKKLSGDIIVNNVNEIYGGIFANSDITSIRFTSQISVIHDSAFNNCKYLKTIDLSNQDELVEIGDSAFNYCLSLESIFIPNSITKLGNSIFFGSGIKSVEFENNVNLEEFDLGIFSGCNRLTSVRIPEGVKNVHISCLSTPLVSVTIPSTASTITEYFGYNSLVSLTEVINLSSTELPSELEARRNIYTEEADNIIIEENGLVFLKNKDNSYILMTYIKDDKFVELPDEILNQQYEVHPAAFYSQNISPRIIVGEWFAYDSAYFADYIVPTIIKKETVYIIDNYLVKDYNDSIIIVDILSDEKEIVLPEQINGKDYSINSDLFEENKNITSVYIPASVGYSAGYLSFKNATSLVSVVIEKGSKIKANDFSGCKNLVTIPQKENLHTSTINFKGCESLEYVELPEGLEQLRENMFENCYSLKSVDIPSSVTKIYNYAFSNCKSLETITLPTEMTYIYPYTFSGCESLKTIVIPETVKTIGAGAFQDCKALTSIIIPSSVTTLGSNSFMGCSSLRNVTLSENLTKIYSYTFAYCSKLSSITIPDNIVEIEYSAFAYSGITSVKFNEESKLTTLGNDVFEYCDNLTSITLPVGITSIPNRAFYKARNLISVSLKEGLLSIGKEAFYDCHMLETINIPSSVIEIQDNAFQNCYYLKQLTITNKETTFGKNSFAYCYHLKTATLPIELNNISSDVFLNCYMLKITYIEETI